MRTLLLSFILSISIVFPVLAANYSTLDNRALRTPVEKETDIQTLVDYLTSGLTDAEEKARVIAAWIAYRVDFDTYKQEKYEDSTESNKRDFAIPDSGDPFFTRKGTSKDFADLFQRMAEIAGLQVATIEGYTNSNYRDRASSLWYWNAVVADNKWNLLDISKAAPRSNLDQDSRSNRSYARDIQRRLDNPESLNRKIRKESRRTKVFQEDDKWFFVKPKDMIETHFPRNPDWQLLNPPVRSSRFFK
ncbi:MAG: hypothetical protein IKD08_06295 [Alphaproteobacteria bacterium]|nr:hypothetical protein [Alphaproteobacteria bacterium]